MVPWFARYRLNLNVNKCSRSSFTRKQTRISTCYHISEVSLKYVTKVKDLGVYFDTNLSFTTHIKYIVSKAYEMLAFIWRYSSAFTDPYTLKLLYTSLVTSRLDCACFIWRPYIALHISRVERIQFK